MAFDVQGARQAGYSDAEIADHLADTAKFDAAAARKAGYSDQELISYLADTGPLTFRDKPVDDPSLPTVSEYGDIGPTASFNTSAPQPAAPSAPVLDDYGRPIPTAPLNQGSPESKAGARSTLGLPDQPTPEQSTLINGSTPAERVWQSVKEGWQNAPTILPPDSGQQVTPGSGLGVNQPLVTIGNTILGAGNALLSGAQRFAYESLAPYSKPLARDVAALPEAFPTGDYGQVPGPRTALQARNAVERTTPQVPLVPQAVTDAITSPFSATRPISAQEVMDAIKRSDIKPQVQQNGMMPGEPAPDQVQQAASQPQPQPTATPQTDTTGLAAGVGGMGTAISESLRDHLWSQLQKGDLTEAGAPSTILQAAKAQVDSGAIKTRADFDQFYQNYGDQLRAQRTGQQTQQQPGPQPTETPQPAATGATAPDSAWVGSTVDQVHNLVQQHAAQGGPASLNAAATPEQLAAMSPDMAKAYRRMAEVNRVVSPIEGENTSTIVPGSVPTKAEGVGSPLMSDQERLVAERKPELFTGPNGRLTQNNAARLNLYDEMTLSDPQIQTLKEDQGKQARADTAIVNQNAGPVDGAPVAAQLKQMLNDPRILEQPDILKVLRPIHDALYDTAGNLKTNIQSYWGMHDNLMTELAKSKDPLNASSSQKFAFDQLTDAKKAIDDAMSKASGGAFQTFLDNQRAFFQQRNAATILRDFRSKPGMINPKTGYIQPNAFHRFVTDLAVRRGRPGIDPAMDIPDDVMGKLMDINDDLKRSGRIDLGQPRGSQTNLFFALANGLGIAGAHSLVHAMGGGPFANVILQRGIEGFQNRMGNWRLNRLANESLNYPPAPLPPNPNPPGQFIPPTLRNTLTP